MISLFGPLFQTVSVQLQLSRLPSTDWWNAPLSGVYLLNLANVSHLPLVYIPTNLVLDTLYQFSTPHFNPNPTFLGVTFDRIFSFKHHVLSLRKKFHSRFRAFRSIASASFLTPTHITSVDRMHRSSYRVIAGCLSSIPIFLFQLEAIHITLTHQSLSYFE